MQDVTPKWLAKGLVLVCERCSKERIPEEDPEAAERIGDFHLRDWLKAKLKEDGRWGSIRAVNTSCMDVCARGASPPRSFRRTVKREVFVVDPLDDKDALYDEIVECFESLP